MRPLLTFLDLRGEAIQPMEPPIAPTVLCLGNFDGVHRAHVSLLQEACHMATIMANRTDTLPLCGAFSFFRPSSDLVGKPSGVGHLTTLREKLFRFRKAGMDFACLCHFEDVRHLTPDEFLSLLVDQAHCRGAVCGENFRFGIKGSGNAEFLRQNFESRGANYQTAVMPLLFCEGEAISSTRIRTLLTDGQTEAANHLLGRPYTLEATVVHGKHLGHALGFPTANLYFPAESLIPARGVYASLCNTPFGCFPAVSNVGVRPTVDTHARINCETYILGFDHDLYGTRIRVSFLKHLRGEQTFPDLAALIAAVRHDADMAESYIRTYQNHLSD